MGQLEQNAKKMSELVPTFLRHMYPYVFQPMSIPPSQVLALVSIEERGGCTLSELRKEMHVSAPTISGIINRLVRDGYVTRSVDKIDRRVKNVVLTSKGKAIIKKFRSNIEKRWKYILSKAPSATGETIVQVVSNITKGFKDGTL